MSVIVSMPTRCIVLSGRMCISLYVEVQTLNRPVLRGSVLNSFSGSYDSITEPHRLFSSSLCFAAQLHWVTVRSTRSELHLSFFTRTGQTCRRAAVPR